MDAKTDPAAPLSRFTLDVRPGAAADFERLRWSLSPICEIDADDPSEGDGHRRLSDVYTSPELAISTGRLPATRFDRTEPVIARSILEGVIAHIYNQGEHLVKAAGVQI